jgi:MFS family permease
MTVTNDPAAPQPATIADTTAVQAAADLAVAGPAVPEAPTTTDRGRLGLLRHADFRRLWIGDTASVFGSAISGIAVPLIALEMLNAGSFIVGLLNAASWLPWLFVSLPAGAWIDRLPRRRTMIVCNLIWLALVASVPIAAWLDLLTTTQLVVICLLGGVVSVFFGPADGAYLPSLIAKEDLPEGNAKLQGSEQAAVVAGSSLGGVLLQVFGAMLGMIIDAVTFVISTVLLLRIRTPEEPPPPASERTTTLRQEIAEGFRFVVRDRYLRVLTAGAAVDNLLLSAGQALLVVFLVRTLGASPGEVGVLLAFDCLGGIVGAVLANKLSRRIGTARALLVWAFATTPFAILLPLAGGGAGTVPFALGLLIPSAGIVAGNVIGGSFRQAYCPSHMLGRVSTTGSFISFSLIPLGAVVGGAAAAVIGVREVLLIVTIAGVFAKLILLIGPIKHQRDLPTEPPVAAALTPSTP